MHTTNHHRMPRAGLDPIDGPGIAISTLSMVMRRPPRFETILLLLDEAQCGRSIVTVSGTTDPDAVIEVVEFVSDACEQLSGLVVASVRPGDHPSAADDHDGDVDRWLEMSETAALRGVELLEWFVIGRTVRCPRDQLGETPRW